MNSKKVLKAKKSKKDDPQKNMLSEEPVETSKTKGSTGKNKETKGKTNIPPKPKLEKKEKSKKESTKEVKKRQFTDDELRAREIDYKHSEELRERKFTNNPEDLFLQVRTLEEQFKYKILRARLDAMYKTGEFEKKLSIKYHNARDNKEKEIARDIHDMEIEIDHLLNVLKLHENMTLSQIDLAYKLNKSQLIEEALDIIGLNFMCTAECIDED
ncbi:MAG: hypothetical protein ACTSYI_02525 [Promethearchaeota archaeon]